MPPCGVGLKCRVPFVVGSRRLIIQSRLDPSPRIRGISNPSQSRPLLGQAPGVACAAFFPIPKNLHILHFFVPWCLIPVPRPAGRARILQGFHGGDHAAKLIKNAFNRGVLAQALQQFRVNAACGLRGRCRTRPWRRRSGIVCILKLHAKLPIG